MIAPANWKDSEVLGDADLRAAGEQITHAAVALAEGMTDAWFVWCAGRQLVVICDEANDCLRIMATVVELEHLDGDQLGRALSTGPRPDVDASYAVEHGFLWSIFRCPLDLLCTDIVLAGMHLVTQLAESFPVNAASLPGKKQPHRDPHRCHSR
jgi:hypothetical protein